MTIYDKKLEIIRNNRIVSSRFKYIHYLKIYFRYAIYSLYSITAFLPKSSKYFFSEFFMEMSYQKYLFAIGINILLKFLMLIDHFTPKIILFEISFLFLIFHERKITENILLRL